MPITLDVTAGWTYTTGDTATASNLNALGLPTVKLADDETHIVAVGSLSAPGIAFNGDTNTGIAQLAGADSLSIVTAGTELARITTTQFGFSNTGNSVIPSITWIGDADTGFGHITGNAIDVISNGAIVASFSPTGLNVVGNVEADSITVNGLAVKTGGVDTATVSVSTDFLGSSGSWGTTSTTVATGAVAAVSPPGSGTADTGSRGLVTLTVTAVSDRAVVTFPFSPVAPSGIARIRIIAGSISSGSQRYELLVGIFNALTTTSSSGSGAWFQYVDSASAQWQTVTYNGTTRETQTTAVTYTNGNEYTLEIRHTSANTFAFYINGTLATTHSTVTFASPNFQYIGAGVEKLVGSGAIVIYVDSIEGQTPLTRT